MNKCLTCNKKTNNPKFCCSSCSAKTTNKIPKRIKKISYCKLCNKETSSYKQIFCSKRCRGKFTIQQNFKLMEQKLKPFTKDYLLYKLGNQCQRCKITDWNNEPITIQLEHIDGNSENNTKENLTLLCPNCHSQTTTYAAKNKGNGKKSRMIKYYKEQKLLKALTKN